MEVKRLMLILLMVSMALGGSMSICMRNLTNAGLSSFDSAFLRLSITTVALLIILLIHDPSKLRVAKKDIPFLVLFGIFKFLADYTFFESVNNINVCLAALFQNTAPYFVLVVSFFLFKERVGRRALLAIMLGTFACVLMGARAILASTFDPVGLVFAILSGFFLGMFYIGGRISNDRNYHPATFLFYMMLVAAIASMPFVNFGTIAGSMTNMSVVVNALVLGLAMTLFPYYIMAKSIKYLGQLEVAVISVSEVVFASLVGIFYFNEPTDFQDVIGIAVMMVSILLISTAPASEKKGGR